MAVGCNNAKRKGVDIGFHTFPRQERVDRVSEENSEHDTLLSERKFIVFESSLNKLISTCQECFVPYTCLLKSTSGTLLTIEATCLNGHTFVWHSQPRLGQKVWGNICLAGGILFTGCNPTKTLRKLEKMKIPCMSARAFFVIQKKYLLKSVMQVCNLFSVQG